ncbi:MAG: precorrin-6y C5,15-methyltransferase (decarboxylating) subunit CbiE, partial [Desulfofustis sp.]
MAEKLSDIIVAGVNGVTMPAAALRLLRENGCRLFCSQSLLETVVSIVPAFDRGRWSSIVPIADCFDKIRSASVSQPILILVSGDPLFFGLGKRLKRSLADNVITFLPSVSYMQSCFAHFGLAWDDAEIISLHGRPLSLLDTRLNAAKLFIFTDPENSPNRIASYLLERFDAADRDSVEIMVGECLGTDEEQCSSATLEETAVRTYAQPNCMIVVNDSIKSSPATYALGLSEDDIIHSRGLITKNEVRAAVLHRLKLPKQGIFWDVGAGSGSISLEAARMCPGLTVIAFEQNEEQLANIRANKQQFGCRNLRIIAGEAPEVCSRFETVDRVFIGGSGGRLEDIVACTANLTGVEQRIVVTAVLEKT